MSAPRVGISACLLGQEVRWDGGHKRDRTVTDVLAPYVEWVPVCPEVELGMGVPRKPVRLVRGHDGAPRMVEPETGKDWTRALEAWAEERLRALAALDLCGYVLKSASPSCGLERVELYDSSGLPSKTGTGLFAAALLRHFPGLPIEDADHLHDPHLREAWLERISAYRLERGRS